MKQLLLNFSANRMRPTLSSALSLLRIEFLLAVFSGAAIATILGSAFLPGLGATAALAVFGAGVMLAGYFVHHSYPHGEFGVCNLITTWRLALTASLASLLVAPAPATDADLWLAFAIATIALSLDGIDGWAARRARLSSSFGARFDMEVDAFFALLLATIIYAEGKAGLWVLLLGVPRYAFLLAGMIWPTLTRDLPDRFSRKAVCVFQIAVLVAFLVPVIPHDWLTAGAALASLAIVWSFTRDILYLTHASP